MTREVLSDILNGKRWDVITGDCLEILRGLPDGCVDSCVTSPPYFNLRDYGHPDQIGLEETPGDYCAKMVAVFAEVRRILKPSGVCWLNIGDSYVSAGGNRDGEYEPGLNGGGTTQRQAKDNRARPIGIAPKNLLGIPWRLAFALQADGWYLRDAVIWHKPNPMPESVTDRCTKSYETVFMLAKSERYFFDAEAIAEPVTESTKARLGQPNLEAQAGSDRVPGKTNGNMKAVGPRFGGNKYGDDDRIESATKSGNEVLIPTHGKRNRRNVWSIATQPCKEAHFAVMPPDLARLCIVSATPHGGIVFDPFTGAGTTGMVAGREGRQFLGTELNPDYAEISRRRIAAAYAQGKLNFDE